MKRTVTTKSKKGKKRRTMHSAESGARPARALRLGGSSVAAGAV
jgi:hypothetical protein